jgi:hypothetical protein
MQSSKRRYQSSNNKRTNTGRAIKSAMPGRTRERDTKLNVQRRQKLAMTLVEQLTKKLKAENNRDIVQNEVEKLMRKELINDRDLKQLEKTIQNKINVKTNNETLKYNLIKNSKANNFSNNFQEENIYGDNNANNNEDELDNSYMSGASDLDKFNEKSKKDRDREEKIKKYKSCLCLKEKPIRPKVEIDFSQYKNEWDAINDYNKHKFEEEQEEEKRKNWETKMRTRAHLNDQIKQKIKKEYEEELKKKEYDQLMDKHLKHLNELEAEKQRLLKERALKTKELRDKQKREQYVNKRINEIKDKLYERELVRQNKEEIRKAKEREAARKKADHEELLKTIKDNELHKKLMIEQAKKEREEDIRMMQDAIASDIKKDNERKAYFNRIERSGNVFAQQAIDNVLKARNDKAKADEEKLNNYLMEKERLAEREYCKMRNDKKNNQKMLRDFYDKQVLEKKAKDEYEKQLDKVQADIWKKDCEQFFEREKETNKMIRDFEKNNVKELDKQVKMGKYDVDKMTEFEKEYNYELLQKANEFKKRKCLY